MEHEMHELPDQEKLRIVEKLEERGATLPCPRCGNQYFSLLDGYFNQPIQSELSNIEFGGTSIPSVVVACNRCGYLSQHALGVLGLLSTVSGVRDG
jgi:ribosomal protein L37E